MGVGVLPLTTLRSGCSPSSPMSRGTSIFISVSCRLDEGRRIKANPPAANLWLALLCLLAEIPRLKLTSGYQQIDLERQIDI